MRLESHLKKVNSEHLSKQSVWQSVEENKQMMRKDEHFQTDMAINNKQRTCTQRFSHAFEAVPGLFESSCFCFFLCCVYSILVRVL